MKAGELERLEALARAATPSEQRPGHGGPNARRAGASVHVGDHPLVLILEVDGAIGYACERRDAELWAALTPEVLLEVLRLAKSAWTDPAHQPTRCPCCGNTQGYQ